ncbi:PP2C family protein-serine/threonine phosphatase [Actinacidiphila sp. ITFR-21]|uniref:PP2C family protein-serine/threonine phosphatase n=1 Tax=Actinacidiphila sp. ITFR-21 TaxID=3075199 RepID=UPI00288A2C88|nr:PP2C family protein-serine/threonine phosphatase [Streptomyces sp. ITFR-21]WNI14397.1 PP2C family protein-serine/threonine phosphatase [Streptomyces sp. ITFR-21]
MTTPERPRRRRVPRHGGDLSRLSPLLLTAVIGSLAVSTPKDFTISRLLPAAPALAASMWSVAATVALGVLTMLLVLGVQFAYGEPATAFAAAAVAAVTAAAAYAAHVRLQRERTLTRVRSVADAAQAVVLRPVPRHIGGVGIESLYLAAAEEARIGGDFFEALETPYGVRLLLGDVRGKGLSAVGVASALTNSFREAAYDEPDLAGVARRLDVTFGRYTASRPADDAAERFATAVFAQIPPVGDRVELLNCGHPPPLLLCGSGVRRLDPDLPSPPLNMAALIGGGYHVDAFRLAPGDALLLCTDGVTETRDRAGAFFPLLEWARRLHPTEDGELLGLLHEQLVRFSDGGLDDDIAALVVRREAGPPAAFPPPDRPSGPRPDPPPVRPPDRR